MNRTAYLTFVRGSITSNQTDFIGGYYYPYHYTNLETGYTITMKDMGETIVLSQTFAVGSGLDLALSKGCLLSELPKV